MTRRSIFTLNDLRAEFAACGELYPTPLPPELYDRAEAQGFEMDGYYPKGRAPTTGATPMAAVSTFWIEQKDDETIKLFVGETPVGQFNHDEHGWAGISAATTLFERIAKAVGVEVKRI